MLYRPWTTQPAEAEADWACLQLCGLKPGDGPPSIGHQLWLEISQESLEDNAYFNSVKGELMKINSFVLFTLSFFPLLLFWSLDLCHLRIIICHFYCSLRGIFSYLLHSSMARSKVRIGHKAALLEPGGIQCLAQGHFGRAEAYHFGAWMIVLLTSELTLHRQLHTALCVSSLCCIFHHLHIQLISSSLNGHVSP